MLPFSYALRNLWRRRARTIVTILGVGITTLLVTTMAAFASGLGGVTGNSARHDVAVLLGTSAEVDLVRSVIPRGNAEGAAAAAPGIRVVDGLGINKGVAFGLEENGTSMVFVKQLEHAGL